MRVTGHIFDPAPLLGGTYVDEIVSARAHRSRAVLDPARPRPDAAEAARRARQGSRRDLLQRLSRASPRHEFRLPSGVLAYRHQNDAQFRGPHSARSDQPRHRLSGQELPGKAEARRQHHPRASADRHQGVAGADTGLAAARPARHPGRRHLVHRADDQQARTGRSEERPGQGISAQDAAHRAARAGRG